jgi:uncharacterized protein (TIGR03492 family)
MTTRLLLLSNGHGEDLIALRIIEALQLQCTELEISVLALVGEGKSFANLENVFQLGPLQRLPSGGFSNQSLWALLKDLWAGLGPLSFAQLQSIRRWSKAGDGVVLAVGDLLPLLMAWGSGKPYGFIGTPKSDYTWSSGPGCNPLADAYHRLKGSEWDPWEWALMARPNCRLVVCRDSLTARGLRRHGVKALAPGNPMMDGFITNPLPPAIENLERVLLLPGSRCPEALRNLKRLLLALAQPQPPANRLLMLACGSRPNQAELNLLLPRLGYRCSEIPLDSQAQAAWQGPAGLLLIGSGLFATWAPWAQVGVACAGTATEQLVGTGCGALSLAGPGPQFTLAFAKRQSRLLGGAVRVCREGPELQRALRQLLNSPALQMELGRIGRQRMGNPGGSAAIAELVSTRLLINCDVQKLNRNATDPIPKTPECI